MKLWKRNVIVGAVLMLVCAGIYLNWRYGDGRAEDLVSTLNEEKLLDEASLVMSTQEQPAQAVAQQDADQLSQDDYFAKMRLSRQESRDGAVQLLQETISYAGEDEDISASAGKLDQIDRATDQKSIADLTARINVETAGLEAERIRVAALERVASENERLSRLQEEEATRKRFTVPSDWRKYLE